MGPRVLDSLVLLGCVDMLVNSLLVRGLTSKLSELPLGKDYTGLFIDRRHQGGQHLVHVANAINTSH
jgi:hypothetical protein